MGPAGSTTTRRRSRKGTNEGGAGLAETDAPLARPDAGREGGTELPEDGRHAWPGGREAIHGPDMSRPAGRLAPERGGPVLARNREVDGERAPLSSEERTSIWPAIHPRLLALVREHRSTILFVNSRRLSERIALELNELAGEDLVRAHHGSISHTQRAEIEEHLKAGTLRGIVATSSLEPGIDMGAVDLVVQVESPVSVARGLQRVGRAGHHVGEVSHGRVFPKFRGDLLECAVIAERMMAGDIERAFRSSLRRSASSSQRTACIHWLSFGCRALRRADARCQSVNSPAAQAGGLVPHCKCPPAEAG